MKNTKKTFLTQFKGPALSVVAYILILITLVMTLEINTPEGTEWFRGNWYLYFLFWGIFPFCALVLNRMGCLYGISQKSPDDSEDDSEAVEYYKGKVKRFSDDLILAEQENAALIQELKKFKQEAQKVCECLEEDEGQDQDEAPTPSEEA